MVYFENDALILIINNHKHQFQISEISDRLAKADEADRNNFRISPSGYGIHWPTIDEDLSVHGLLLRHKGLKNI